MAADDGRALRSSSWWDAGALDRIGHRLAVPDAGLPRGVVHRPAGDRDPQQLERGGRLQRAPARPRGAREARRAAGGRLPRRDPGDLAGRADHQADGDALSEPDGHGRRGADPRQSRRRRRPPRELRQDHPGQPHGRGERRRPGNDGHRRPDAQRPLPQRERRRVHGLLATPRRAPGGPDHAGRLGRVRGRDVPQRRALLADGHRIDDGLPDRGARDGARRQRGDPRRGFAAGGTWPSGPAPRSWTSSRPARARRTS